MLLHAVVDEIDLPLAIAARAGSPASRAAVDTAITSVTMLRRSCGAVVSELMSRRPEHAHVQRARDRRGRHRQHVDGLAHLLQSLFVRDAEALLFVDDDQAQVGELHVLADQAMRADEDVDLALGQLLDRLLLLARRS